MYQLHVQRTNQLSDFTREKKIWNKNSWEDIY